MNLMGKRSAVVLGIVMSLAIASPALSGPAAGAATPVLPVEPLVGGGTGIYFLDANFPVWTGSYSSTSQLGNGRVDLVGGADIASAHLVLAITEPTNLDRHGVAPAGFLMRGTVTLRHRLGYAMVDSDGTTYTFGGVEHLGDAHTSQATDLKLTPSHNGYWIVNAAGQVFAFGDAGQYGSVNSSRLVPGETVTSMSVTPSGKGYWLFTSKGRAVTLGDAHFFGDLHATPLTGPVVGSVATPTGHGYYMVGSDGGVFTFANAPFFGSNGNTPIPVPIVNGAAAG